MVLKQNVGIDVSMDTFDVNLTLMDENFDKQCKGRKKFNNNEEGFVKLLDWIDKHMCNDIEISYTMEFTGVYYERLAYWLKSSKQIVFVVIPSKAKWYCASLSKSSKTDKLDAQALSWMGLERQLKEWNPLSLGFLNLRTLTREREELLKEKTVVKNRLHATCKKAIGQVNTVARYHQRLQIVVEQIAEIEREILALIKEDELLYDKVENITTIPGVALITAATVIAETNGFSAINNQKQLTSYAGLDVKIKESGKYKGNSKISKQGNSHIRRVLHFPAQTAIIHNKPLSVFYKRINEHKIKPMIAGVGVQRKLLCLIYILWKTDNTFDPYYEINKYHKIMKKVG
ncbi:MAG: transposase [Salinivirgaceae bacterium]|nr:transposase [Salinivirgaceae bacterium]